MRDNILLVTNCLVILVFMGIGFAAMADGVALCRALSLLGMSVVVGGSLLRHNRESTAKSAAWRLAMPPLAPNAALR